MSRKVSYISNVRPSFWLPDDEGLVDERVTYGLPVEFPSLPMIRGRRRWLTPLPACVFQPSAVHLSPDLQLDFIRVAVQRRQESPLGYFRPYKEFTMRAGRAFFSAPFLEEMAPFFALPRTAAAFARYARAVDEGSVTPVRHTASPPRHESPGWDRVWQPWEDQVLRAWFGRHTMGEHAGQHVPLTEHQWELVLQMHLKGRRTKAQVKTRISTLNRALRVSMLVDGFLPRDKVVEFQRQALGEHRVQVPRFRPRIKGRGYRGDNERPLLGQPD